MFKADLKSDTLKGLVNIISTLIDEVKFTIGPDGMTLKAVDAAHVAMIEMEVGKDAFESYEADSCEIGLDLDKVKGVLKLASSGDIVSMEQDDTHGRLVFKVGNITRRMNLVDTATMNDPKVPQLSLATSISLMVDELQKGIRAADTISDHITLRAGPDFFELSCEGDTDSVSLRLEGSSLLGIEAAEEVRSMFPLDYFVSALNGLKGSILVNMETDFPIALNSQAPFTTKYLLAPRIEEE